MTGRRHRLGGCLLLFPGAFSLTFIHTLHAAYGLTKRIYERYSVTNYLTSTSYQKGDLSILFFEVSFLPVSRIEEYLPLAIYLF